MQCFLVKLTLRKKLENCQTTRSLCMLPLVRFYEKKHKNAWINFSVRKIFARSSCYRLVGHRLIMSKWQGLLKWLSSSEAIALGIQQPHRNYHPSIATHSRDRTMTISAGYFAISFIVVVVVVIFISSFASNEWASHCNCLTAGN